MSTGLMLEIIFFCYMMCNFGSKKSQNFKVLIFNIILIKIIGTDIYSVYNTCKALFQAFCVCVCVSCSVVSHSLWPHRLKPTRLFCPWNSPGKKTEMGCHAPLQRIVPTQVHVSYVSFIGRFFSTRATWEAPDFLFYSILLGVVPWLNKVRVATFN